MNRAWLALALLLAACAPVQPAPAPPPPPPPPAAAAPPTEESNGRIVNGVPAAPGSARWQVELRRFTPYASEKPLPDWQRRHSCGGVLIAPNYVLTAAHCVAPGDDGLDLKANYLIRAGSLDLREPMREYRIVRVVIHARYRTTAPPAHDIALLEIAPPRAVVSVTEEPTPIALPTGVVVPPTARVTVTGWGYTVADTRGSSPSGLLAAVLRLIPAAACTITGTNRPIDPAQHLCAGPNDPARPADSCQGDSGGPLTWQGPGRRSYLVGLVSWGPAKTCGGGSPGIYTNVASYLDWIERAKLAPEGQL